MTIGVSVRWRIKPLWQRGFVGAIFAVALLAGANAYAVSDNVKNACRDDYFQHCSQFAVDTEELRQCMRKVGENLSTPCLVALVQDGQITKEDVERHNAEKAGGAKPAGTKTASTKKKDAKKEQEVASKEPDDPKSVGSKSGKKHKTTSKGKKSNSPADATAEPTGTKIAEATGKPSDITDPAKPGTGTKPKKSSKKKSKKSKASGAGKSAPGGQAAADYKTAKTPAAEAEAAAPSDPKAGDAKPKSAKKKKGGSKSGATSKSKKTAKKTTATKKTKKALDAQSP